MLGQAALDYARRGWPVFPCLERDREVDDGKGGKKTLKGKQPYIAKGFLNATTDEEIIKGWWRRWPDAMIALAMGRNGMFALDFDPRHDAETGETFDLVGLKAALEEQMGCPLPPSLTAMTQSDGVHVYLLQPAEGEPIANRGNLPRHVDVRGKGGYVIAPPSILYRPDGSEGRYRWFSNRHDGPAEPPAVLVEILRSPKVKPESVRAPATGSAGRSAPRAPAGDHVEEAIRKYGDSALLGECRALRSAPDGNRNTQLNESALKIAALTVSKPYPALHAGEARAMLLAAARDNTDDDESQLVATLNSGWSAGVAQPRDLTDVAEKARQRAQRPYRSRAAGSGPSSPPASSSRPPDPHLTNNGKPASQSGGKAAERPEKEAGEAAGADLTLKCAQYAMTDLGNLERFMARFGDDFLFVDAWAPSSNVPGIVAWDRQRWNRKLAPSRFARASQDTVRLIQDEADFIRDSGVPFPPPQGDVFDDDDDIQDDEDPAQKAFLKSEVKRRGRRSAMWWLQHSLARKTKYDGPRHDYIVQVKSNGDIVLFSDKLAAWGRTSEASGHIESVRRQAPARLSATPEDFDTDALALNVQNGTLVFHRPENGQPARVELREHRREDRITKMCRATYDPVALCPQFDAFLAQVQPKEDMREFLARWSGYNALGIADAQVFSLFYGEGSNGKGVWVQTHAHILGDYAWATGIETFMDSGFKRPGAGPSPHLAALLGRRMVYANEPEEHSKFSDGLVKALTSDEPIGGVRELYGPAFELMITFSNSVMANNLPRIGTDWGIRRRMQVVPWDVIIPKDQQDLRLKDRLKAEISGILNNMVRGALAYLTDGLTMPEAMVEATKAYHAENDILGQFLDLCIARAPGETLGSTAMHELFTAWQTRSQLLKADGKPWSPKYLASQMEKKGFKKDKSNTMRWHDIVARFDPPDFLWDGKPTEELPPARHSEKPSAALPVGAVPEPPPVPPSPLPPLSFDEDDDMPP